MKKIIILSILVISVLLIASSVAMAGGWSIITTESALPNTPGNGYWSVADEGAPHGNFSTGTNRCRVCHAVHMADPSTAPTVGSRIVGPTSWRLLRNQNRTEECYYCHGPDGATDKQPYRSRGTTVFSGEHTLGSTLLPDSATTTVPGINLTCGTCHNVHAADVVRNDGAWASPSVESSMVAFMAARILKNNPNPLGLNTQIVSTDTGAALGAAGADPFTKFCSDCHDVNPNWDTATDDATNAAHLRPNSKAHVMGPADDGQLEVYGQDVQVANYTTGQGNPYYAEVWGYRQDNTVDAELPTDGNTFFKDTVLTSSAKWGCRGCHRATDKGNIKPGYAGSAFPHRTVGAKLLFDDFATGTVQDASSTVNDATRVLPTMDRVCTKCHRSNGGVDFGLTTTSGVGITF